MYVLYVTCAQLISAFVAPRACPCTGPRPVRTNAPGFSTPGDQKLRIDRRVSVTKPARWHHIIYYIISFMYFHHSFHKAIPAPGPAGCTSAPSSRRGGCPTACAAWPALLQAAMNMWNDLQTHHASDCKKSGQQQSEYNSLVSLTGRLSRQEWRASGCTRAGVELYVPVRRAQPPRPLPPPQAAVRHIHRHLHYTKSTVWCMPGDLSTPHAHQEDSEMMRQCRRSPDSYMNSCLP
jgi:hypothetical protein